MVLPIVYGPVFIAWWLLKFDQADVIRDADPHRLLWHAPKWGMLKNKLHTAHPKSKNRLHAAHPKRTYMARPQLEHDLNTNSLFWFVEGPKVYIGSYGDCFPEEYVIPPFGSKRCSTKWKDKRASDRPWFGLSWYASGPWRISCKNENSPHTIIACWLLLVWYWIVRKQTILKFE